MSEFKKNRINYFNMHQSSAACAHIYLKNGIRESDILIGTKPKIYSSQSDLLY